MRFIWIAILFVACSKDAPYTKWEGIFFDIPFALTIAHPLSSSEKAALAEELTAIFSHIDETLNIWNPNSILSQYNQTGGALPQPLQAIISQAKDLQKKSNGLFNPTMHREITTWKAALKAGHTPSSHQKGGYDLDGLLKGYAVDAVAALLRQKGYTSFLINWSGDLYAAGRKPDRTQWSIFLPELNKTVSIENQGLATSGSKNQRWHADGKWLTHIFNPRTGSPLPASLESITITAPTATEADAYATSFFCASSLGIPHPPLPGIKLYQAHNKQVKNDKTPLY